MIIGVLVWTGFLQSRIPSEMTYKTTLQNPLMQRWHLKWAEIVALKAVHDLLLRTCGYVTFHGRKGLCRCNYGQRPWDQVLIQVESSGGSKHMESLFRLQGGEMVAWADLTVTAGFEARKGAMSQGMWEVAGSWKKWGKGFLPGAPRNTTLPAPWF